MWLLKYTKKKLVLTTLIILIIASIIVIRNAFPNIKYTDPDYENESGNIRISKIIIDYNNRKFILTNKDESIKIKCPYSFKVQPEIGDSIYKLKGLCEFVLIKKDSTFVQIWDFTCNCSYTIDKWENNKKVYRANWGNIYDSLPEGIEFPIY